MVPSQRTIDSSRAGLLATSQRQRKPSVQDVQSTWEHARHRKREGHAWSIRVGVFGENRTIVEPFTPFLCVVENKGPINEESVFKLVGHLLDVREKYESGTVHCIVQAKEKEFENEKEKKYAVKLARKDYKIEEVFPTSRRDEFKDAMITRKRTFCQAFIEFQDNLYNLKGASKDDSSFKALNESEDSDNSNSDDGRDVEEITPSSFGRELVEHEDAESLPSGPGAPTSTPDEDAKTLALDHNIDSEMRLSMSFLQKQVGLATKKSKKGERGAKQNIRGFDNFFQLAFHDGDLWEHQEEIFKLWKEGKVKGQRVKLPTSAQRSRGGSEEALKPVPKDMKITPWRSMQGIQEKHIILPILARVKGGALSLDEMSKEFEKQKMFLYMQRIMIQKLNCKDWNEVQTHHPATSHHSALEHFIFLFKSGTRNLRDPFKSISQESEQHLGRARAERRRLEDAQNIVNNPDISTFVSDDITTLPVQYSMFEGKVENMESFVPRRHYTLGIADAPYGFKAPHSINDDVKYGLSAYKKVIEAFKKVTSAKSWVLVIFHAHDQIFATKKTFVDNSMVHQLCIWTKPNIKGFQLDRLSFATEFATIGFFSLIGLSCKDLSGDSSKIMNPYQKPQLLMMDFIELLSMKGGWILDLFAGTGTTTVSALKKGQNVVAVEMDPLQVRFIQQRVTALKELPDEFQEVGMKNMAAHPIVVDASGEPQPGFGPDDEMQFVDLEPYEEPNLVDATGGSGHGDGGGEDDSLPSGGEDEEDKDEEHEEFPIKPYIF
ncbi:hypothetical protein L7F22_055037 [Adiantum nelumboides]|nr:hypothetical protein [Adiantum nelumboides]